MKTELTFKNAVMDIESMKEWVKNLEEEGIKEIEITGFVLLNTKVSIDDLFNSHNFESDPEGKYDIRDIEGN